MPPVCRCRVRRTHRLNSEVWYSNWVQNLKKKICLSVRNYLLLIPQCLVRKPHLLFKLGNPTSASLKKVSPLILLTSGYSRTHTKPHSMHSRPSGNANEYTSHTYNYFVLKNRVICTMTMAFIASSYLLYIIIILPFYCLVYNLRTLLMSKNFTTPIQITTMSVHRLITFSIHGSGQCEYCRI